MKLNKLINKADDEIFADIIKKCEAKMVSPFKKEEAAPEPQEEAVEESSDEAMADAEPKEEINPDDMQKLLEMYRQIKGE